VLCWHQLWGSAARTKSAGAGRNRRAGKMRWAWGSPHCGIVVLGCCAGCVAGLLDDSGTALLGTCAYGRGCAASGLQAGITPATYGLVAAANCPPSPPSGALACPSGSTEQSASLDLSDAASSFNDSDPNFAWGSTRPPTAGSWRPMTAAWAPHLFVHLLRQPVRPSRPRDPLPPAASLSWWRELSPPLVPGHTEAMVARCMLQGSSEAQPVRAALLCLQATWISLGQAWGTAPSATAADVCSRGSTSAVVGLVLSAKCSPPPAPSPRNSLPCFCHLSEHRHELCVRPRALHGRQGAPVAGIQRRKLHHASAAVRVHGPVHGLLPLLLQRWACLMGSSQAPHDQPSGLLLACSRSFRPCCRH